MEIFSSCKFYISGWWMSGIFQVKEISATPFPLGNLPSGVPNSRPPLSDARISPLHYSTFVLCVHYKSYLYIFTVGPEHFKIYRLKNYQYLRTAPNALNLHHFRVSNRFLKHMHCTCQRCFVLPYLSSVLINDTQATRTLNSASLIMKIHYGLLWMNT